jgi:hypothetical protein
MREQHIHNSNDNAAAKAEIVEWMITLLLSDEQLPEDMLDEIRAYLASEKDEELKREMDVVFLAALQSNTFDESVDRSPLEEEMWPQIADALGMNPDINTYRAQPQPQPPTPANKSSLAEEMWPDIAKALGMNTDLNYYLEDEEDVPTSVALPRRSGWSKYIMQFAVVVIFAVVVAGGYYGWNFMKGNQATFVATVTIEAQADSLRHIVLPDGTEVTLNRHTTFAYNDHRECELSGEAYFKVAKDADHPFVIYSDKVTATVLGTEFNFNTQTENKQSTLSLYSGVVQLDYAAGTQRLDRAGSELTLDRTTEVANVNDFDAGVLPHWLTEEETEDEYYINIIPLGEIFDLIETAYGVKILGQHTVDLSRKYNFILDKSVGIEGAMEALQFVVGGLDYRVTGTTITLDNK